ncbi:MAG: hypothetical protein J7K84_00615 [Deltaproteobacteria bacterium]|nr:hypothetical protein [Deltaproteobacteria bacterium]
MSTKRLLLHGSALSAMSIFLQVAVSFFLMPFIIHSLGERLYGVWLLIAAFVGYYGLLDLGISAAVTRFVSRSIGAGKREHNKYYASSAFFILCGAGLLIIIVSLFAALFAKFFINDPADLHLFKFSVIILGAAIGTSFPLRIFDGVLNANLRFDLKRYIEIGEVVLRSCLIIFFLKLNYGIYGLAVAGAAAMLFDFLFKMLIALKIDRSIVIKISCFNYAKLKEMAEYAVFTFVAGLAQILNNRIDLYVVIIFANLTVVSYYGIALSLVSYFYQFFASTQGILGPFFSQKEGEKNFSAIRQNLMLLTRLSSIISSVLVLLIILYGKQFVFRWLGESFCSTYLFMFILFSPLIFSYGLFPTLFVLNTTGHHRLSTILDLLRGGMNLILSLILGHFFGAPGVAWGTVIPAVLFDIILKPAYSCKVIGLSPFKLWSNVGFVVVVTTILFAPVWFFIGRNVSNNYLELIAIACLHIVVFLFPAYFLFFNKTKRVWLMKHASAMMNR